MNRKQKTAVVIGALAVVGWTLFPPFIWHAHMRWGGGEIYRETRQVKFRWVLTETKPINTELVPGPYPWRIHGIDGLRYFVLVTGITALTIAAVVLLAERKKRPVAETFD